MKTLVANDGCDDQFRRSSHVQQQQQQQQQHHIELDASTAGNGFGGRSSLSGGVRHEELV